MDKEDYFDDKVILLRRDSIIPWIKSYTKREKIFFLLNCIALLITLILVIVLGSSKASAKSHKCQITENNCLSGACLQQASLLLNHMNQSVDPCEDFYTYACGKFSSINQVDDGLFHTVDLISTLKESRMEKIRKTLEKKITVERNYSESSERKLKVMFHSCMNNFKSWKLKGQPMLEIIKELGGWYVLETWNEDLFNRDILVQKIKGDCWADIFFGIQLITKIEDPQVKRIFITEEGWTTLTYFYSDVLGDFQDKRDAIEKFIFNSASLMLQDSKVNFTESKRAEKLKTFVNDVMTFETKLHNITLNKMDVEARSRIITLAELNVQANAFDWITLFKRIFSDQLINGSTEIHCWDTNYLIEVSNYVKTIPNRTFHNYLIWKLIHAYAGLLSYEYFNQYQILDNSLFSDYKRSEIWEYCVHITYMYMNEVVTAILIEESIKKNNFELINVMIDDLKSNMMNIIDHFQWMDVPTKTVAKKKLNSLKIRSGFESIITNRTALDQLYSELQVNETNYFQTILNVKKFEKRILIHMMMNTSNITEWKEHNLHHQDYEPKYISQRNEIKIPSLIINPPVFHNKFPQFVNYGILGLLVATEITKSIIEDGRDYDENGEEKNWWSNKTIQEFKKKTSCLYDQITSKTVDFNLDGKIHTTVHDPSQSAMISHVNQIIAVVQVYKSYKLLMANISNDDPFLPGLLLNSTYQGLFLSMAQVACLSSTEETEYKNANEYRNIHFRTRLMHMISQIPEFSEAFQCPHHSVAKMDHNCDLII